MGGLTLSFSVWTVVQRSLSAALPLRTSTCQLAINKPRPGARPIRVLRIIGGPNAAALVAWGRRSPRRASRNTATRPSTCCSTPTTRPSLPMRGTCSMRTLCRRGSIPCASNIASMIVRTASASGAVAASASLVVTRVVICVMCCSTSAATSASLLGKYWYSEPTLTPADSAMRLVLARS